MKKPAILLIYTGGTIGMAEDPGSGVLAPFKFENILTEVPILQRFGYEIDSYSFNPPVDSSDVQPDFWIALTRLIASRYGHYTGFVILHGTDTMSYTASALSFMLENLEKPVILTGSQLPIGSLRTDGKENLISAIEIAAACDDSGHAIVPEVCIFFQNQLFRGNRTNKDNAAEFHAFRSPNYPPLAEAGVEIKYNKPYIHYPRTWGKPLQTHLSIDTHTGLLKIYPGIREEYVSAILDIPGLRGLVIETYGSGNAPTLDWLIDRIAQAIARGIVVLNITQCPIGSVNMDAYATGMLLKKAGVISGYDMTTEAALTKMLLLTGQYKDNELVKKNIVHCRSGEFSF